MSARARCWARIGLAGAAGLGLEAPFKGKRLLVIVESDGCFVDGVSATTGCSVGHRTLRVEDYGKVAATFVDVSSERALRVAPRSDVRQRAGEYAPGEKRRYDAQLQGYRRMPDEIAALDPGSGARHAGEDADQPPGSAGELRGVWRGDHQRAGGRWSDGKCLCKACAARGVLPAMSSESGENAGGDAQRTR